MFIEPKEKIKDVVLVKVFKKKNVWFYNFKKMEN